MKPNILFLANPQSFTHDYKWIIGLNHHVNCFVVPLKSQYKQLTKEDFSILETEDIIILKPIDPFSIVRFYRTISDFFYLIRQIRHHSIQLIHIHYADPSALWALFKPWFNVPMFLTTRGTDILKAIPNVYSKINFINLLLRILYKKAFHRLDYISCTSHSQQNVIAAIFRIIDKVSVIRTGVDWSIIKKQKKVHLNQKLQDRLYWLFPRTMKPIYNHELSLRALHLLSPEILKNRVFVYLNKDSTNSDYVQKIQMMMSELPNLEFCFFDLVDQESMIQLIRHAELVLNTNLSDGSPVTVMEAMSLKKRVLIPPLEYDQQVFSNVLQFKEYSPESLSETIIKILDGYYTPDILDYNYRIIEKYCKRDVLMKQIYDQYCIHIRCY